jgi:hypothetical protein
MDATWGVNIVAQKYFRVLVAAQPWANSGSLE